MRSPCLTEQGDQAAAVPKNLRLLQQLIDRGSPSVARPAVTADSVALADMLKAAFDKVNATLSVTPTGGPSPEVDATSISYMRLVCDELAMNYQVHSSKSRPPRLELDTSRVRVTLPLSDDPKILEEQRQRLRKVLDRNLQHFVDPARRTRRSNGLGLYLANLAAGLAGFRLRIDEPQGRAVDDALFISFVLEQVPTRSRVVRRSSHGKPENEQLS